MLKLFGSLTSPYARKARILVHEKEIGCEFVVEDPWSADSKIPQMNPLGKVPVLQVADDMFVFESPLVMLYLNNLDGRPWGPKDPAGFWRCEWWQALGQGILDAGIARRMEVTRPEDKQMPEKVAREVARIQRALDAAEEAFKGGDIIVDEESETVQVAPGSVPQPPAPWETGFKDTVIAYPGQVTRIRASFGSGGQYVWHCHIVEHEDNEMMRPYRIGPVQPGQPGS